jgi:hypothetical protein
MRTIATMRTAAMWVAIAGIPSLSLGATISIQGHSPSSVKSGCQGGLYSGPAADSKGSYGCIQGDGSGIVCGGVGKYAKTCSTWGPEMKILPTQSQVREWEHQHATTLKK